MKIGLACFVGWFLSAIIVLEIWLIVFAVNIAAAGGIGGATFLFVVLIFLFK